MSGVPSEEVSTPSLAKNSTLAMVPTEAVAVAVRVCVELAGTVESVAGEVRLTVGRLPAAVTVIEFAAEVVTAPELSVATAVSK